MPITAITADDTGLIKELALAPSSTVVCRWGEQACGRGVSRAAWGPDGEAYVGGGHDDGGVRFWRRDQHHVDGQPNAPTPLVFAAGEGSGGAPYGRGDQSVVGLHTRGSSSARVVATDRSGRVRVWPWPEDVTALCNDTLSEFKTVKNVSVARAAQDGAAIAVGGKGFDASLWSVESGQAIWRARNLPNDELDLQVPIWVTDLRTMEESPKMLVTGHGFVQQRLRGEVRLYDVGAKRRHVCRVIAPLGEEAISAVAASVDGLHVFAGSVSGSLARLDVRMGLKPIERYHSIAGSIREIAVHTSLPIVACACLDRKMRIFNWGFGRSRLSAQKKTDPIATVYLKQRLTAILLSTNAGSIAERRALRLRRRTAGEDEEDEGDGDEDVEAMLAELPQTGNSRRVRGEPKDELPMKEESDGSDGSRDLEGSGEKIHEGSEEGQDEDSGESWDETSGDENDEDHSGEDEDKESEEDGANESESDEQNGASDELRGDEMDSEESDDTSASEKPESPVRLARNKQGSKTSNPQRRKDNAAISAKEGRNEGEGPKPSKSPLNSMTAVKASPQKLKRKTDSPVAAISSSKALVVGKKKSRK